MADDDIDGIPLGEEEHGWVENITKDSSHIDDRGNYSHKERSKDRDRRSRSGHRSRDQGEEDDERRHDRHHDDRHDRSSSSRSSRRSRSRSRERFDSDRRERHRDRHSDSSRSGSDRRSRSRDRRDRPRGYEDDYDEDRSRRSRRHHRSDAYSEDNVSANDYGSSVEDQSILGSYQEIDYKDFSQDERGARINGQHWKDKLTSIREAHFNRSRQAPQSTQNLFKNDGSFLEMFKQKMAQKPADGASSSSTVTPNSLVLASSSIPFSPGLSLPPLTPSAVSEEQQAGLSTNEDVDGTPMTVQKPLPMPVSVGKRRLAKPLKTGIVFKKPQKQEEDQGSQEKLDAWATYLKEVQKYKTANCMEDDVSRPLVK